MNPVLKRDLSTMESIDFDTEEYDNNVVRMLYDEPELELELEQNIIRINSNITRRRYRVGKIIDEEIIDGIRFYKVKWRGYSIKDASWEPYFNLDNVKRHIRKFENESYTNVTLKNIENIQKILKPVKKINRLKKQEIGDVSIDIPEKILKIEAHNNKIFSLIKWKKRKSNLKPLNSFCPNSLLVPKYTQLLLDFYCTTYPTH